MYSKAQLAALVADGRMNKEIALRVAGEQTNLRKLIRNILSRGLVVSVNDGGEWPVKRSGSFKEICDNLMACDEEQLVIRDSEGVRVGWFYLVYGNSADEIICDHTANELCEEIYNAVFP
jgi:hypothetical protein